MRSIGLEVNVLDEKDLEALGARGILAVGAGSCNAPRLVTLQWNGGDESRAPIALVGKGVCFDAGGINIKLEHLVDMKMDKAAAATVVGTLQTLAMMRARLMLWVSLALLKTCRMEKHKSQVILSACILEKRSKSLIQIMKGA